MTRDELERKIFAAFEPMTPEQRGALTDCVRWKGPDDLWTLCGPDMVMDRCTELFGPHFSKRYFAILEAIAPTPK